MTYAHDAGYWMSLLAFPAMGIICLLLVLLSKVGRAVRDRRPHTTVRTARRALGTSTPRTLELPRSLARSESDPRRQPRPEPFDEIVAWLTRTLDHWANGMRPLLARLIETATPPAEADQ